MLPSVMTIHYDIDFPERFRPFRERLLAKGLNDILLRNFEHAYARFLAGDVGWLPEKEIEPVESLPDAETLDDALTSLGREHLHQIVVIKLNGGLGTGMGLTHAKSLIPVRNGLSFLDIIARQVTRRRVPLLMMNSFYTHEESIEALKKYPELNRQPRLDFEQHMVPKVSAADFSPALFPERPELEWCPPGHGDFYVSIAASGVLDQLLDGGCRYAFVSNADNLGAVIDLRIFGYFIDRRLDFMMEAADRTPADRKGGHLAMRDGRFILRESAQCPDEDKPHFQNTQRHRYFNTNNLWINLQSLKTLLVENDYLLPLPLIANKKNVDPRDGRSAAVYQLETAMGAVISVFPRTAALRVPRTRFAPVKDTNDLLLVQSDAYRLTDDFQLAPNPARRFDPKVQLDKGFYQFAGDFQKRFAQGVPSLINCRSLTVQGDVYWGKGVRLEGDVIIVNETAQPQTVPDGRLVCGPLIWR